MVTDLERHIEETPLVDSHEHMRREQDWTEQGPDILQDLFGNYVPADLHAAGASPEAMHRLMNAADEDIAGRFEGIREAWEAVQFTGYGEAVRLIAERVYGIQELTGAAAASKAHRTRELQKPGERLRILKVDANLDHIQTDDFSWPCPPDMSGPNFFLYDMSWATFCNGQVYPDALHKETGVGVVDLASLRQAMEALFEKYAPCAVAMKSQHAYNRTLLWRERSDSEAEAALQEVLTKPDNEIGVETRLCLGDWCWQRGVELSVEHNLPFKIHTGYYAGNDRMPVSRIKSGNMCALLARNLNAKFVLMHIAYPYSGELIALAKHYRNVWIDFCWAWSIDPWSSRDALRRCVHAVPINKLFAFGGDTAWPTSAYAYSIQARQEIRRALQAEIDEGYMNEKQAMGIASRIMLQNQRDCFDLDGTRANIAQAARSAE